MERRRVSGTVVAAIDQLLTDQARDAVAAFVYGSVATGQARPSSDVDACVLLAQPVSTATAQQLRASFVQLQERLGYTPDPDYPVELFTVQQIRAALLGHKVAHAIEQALAGEELEPELAEADEVEILRALLGSRLTVRASPQLDELTALANQVLAQQLHRASTTPSRQVLRVLGIRRID